MCVSPLPFPEHVAQRRQFPESESIAIDRGRGRGCSPESRVQSKKKPQRFVVSGLAVDDIQLPLLLSCCSRDKNRLLQKRPPSPTSACHPFALSVWLSRERETTYTVREVPRSAGHDAMSHVHPGPPQDFKIAESWNSELGTCPPVPTRELVLLYVQLGFRSQERPQNTEPGKLKP